LAWLAPESRDVFGLAAGGEADKVFMVLNDAVAAGVSRPPGFVGAPIRAFVIEVLLSVA
jgi:hypothetical protein